MNNHPKNQNHSEIERLNIAQLKSFFFEVLCQHRTEPIHELMDANAIHHYEHVTITGPKNWEKQFYEPLIRAIPDLNVEIMNIAADNSNVMIRWVAKGFFSKELFDINPTQKDFEFSGLTWGNLHDGKITKSWNNWNMSFLYRQLYQEVKTLRGILPLCSFCKKIRDDKGYWEQVDVYIHKYSEADISHSICPECIKKHYTEAFNENENV